MARDRQPSLDSDNILQKVLVARSTCDKETKPKKTKKKSRKSKSKPLSEKISSNQSPDSSGSPSTRPPVNKKRKVKPKPPKTEKNDENKSPDSSDKTPDFIDLEPVSDPGPEPIAISDPEPSSDPGPAITATLPPGISHILDPPEISRTRPSEPHHHQIPHTFPERTRAPTFPERTQDPERTQAPFPERNRAPSPQIPPTFPERNRAPSPQIPHIFPPAGPPPRSNPYLTPRPPGFSPPPRSDSPSNIYYRFTPRSDTPPPNTYYRFNNRKPPTFSTSTDSLTSSLLHDVTTDSLTSELSMLARTLGSEPVTSVRENLTYGSSRYMRPPDKETPVESHSRLDTYVESRVESRVDSQVDQVDSHVGLFHNQQRIKNLSSENSDPPSRNIYNNSKHHEDEDVCSKPSAPFRHIFEKKKSQSCVESSRRGSVEIEKRNDAFKIPTFSELPTTRLQTPTSSGRAPQSGGRGRSRVQDGHLGGGSSINTPTTHTPSSRLTPGQYSSPGKTPSPGYSRSPSDRFVKPRSSNHSPVTRAVQVSKMLSGICRHHKGSEFCILDGGYFSVQEIIDSFRFKKLGVTSEEVTRLVRDNDKQRFSLKEVDGNLFICANQGHTVEMKGLDLELEEITNPELYPTVIHGTYDQAWQSIQRQGLSRMNRTHIHFAPDLPKSSGVISGMRSDCEIAIYINMAAAIRDGFTFYRSKNSVILCSGNNDGVLPPKYFESVKRRKGNIELLNKDSGVLDWRKYMVQDY